MAYSLSINNVTRQIAREDILNNQHRESFKSYNIDGLLHILGTMYQWCVTAYSCGLWNISTPIDLVLDGHIIQMHVNINVLCEQQWLPEPHAGKKSRHILYHQGSLGTICLQQDSDHMCLWPGNHLHYDTTKHGYSGVMKELTGECNDNPLSSVMRVGSVCMRVMDIHVYGIELVGVIFQSAFAHNTQASPQASWCGRP